MMKSFFNKLDKKSALKRTLLLIIPILLMPFGIACYYACGLGADPFSIFVDGEHAIFNLSYGNITLINNIILLTLMLFIGRKYIGIGTVITTFTSGFFIDLFREMIVTAFPAETSSFWIRGTILAIGAITFAVGVAFYIAIEFGIGPMEFIAISISKALKWPLGRVKIILDVIYVIAGYFMGGIVGVGTIVGVIATGPIIQFTLKLIKKPIDKFSGPLLKEIKED